MALHRLTRRPTGRQAAQLVGLTAALAAAAGTGAVALNSSPSGAATAGTSATSAQQDPLTTARIERRQQASRGGSRTDLTLQATRKAQAAEQARIRAAKLAASATLTERRALALAASKALEAQKRAAAVKAAAAAKAAAIAKAKAIAAANARAKAIAAANARAKAIAAANARAKAKAIAAAKAAAAPKIVLPTTGYHLTAHFGQAGGRWAANHTGLDFAAPIGTPVRSVMSGKVIQAKFAGAYGRQVKVRHANGTVTSYSHMSEFDVSVGASVSAGSKVGAIGVTGNTTGPHLHFEVLPNGGPAINPEPWLHARGINP